MLITTAMRQLAQTQRLLTTTEVAELLSITPLWTRRLIRTGQLRATNVGGPEKTARWRVDPEDLAAYIRSRENRRRDLLAS